MPNKKTLIQSVLVFVLIVGSYALYQNWSYYNSLEESVSIELNYDGTHIMPSGAVMTGDGVVIPNATVTEDGMIMLENGELLTPAFDLREPESEKENKPAPEPEPEETVDEEATETDSSEEVSPVQENTDGTHIMQNGDVMTGAGVVLPDAVILADGNIQLGDGTIIEPAFDLRPDDEPVEEPGPVVIDITGDNFTYDIKEIRIKQGDTVTINFSSVEGFHDWVIDEFDAKTTRIDEGESTSVTFVADRAGTFEFYCSVSGHREKGQVGALTVEQESQYFLQKALKGLFVQTLAKLVSFYLGLTDLGYTKNNEQETFGVWGFVINYHYWHICTND